MVPQRKTNELFNNYCREIMNNVTRRVEKADLNVLVKTENTIQLLDHYLGMRAGFSFQAVISCYVWCFSTRKTKSCKQRVIFTSLEN